MKRLPRPSCPVQGKAPRRCPQSSHEARGARPLRPQARAPTTPGWAGSTAAFSCRPSCDDRGLLCSAGFGAGSRRGHPLLFIHLLYHASAGLAGPLAFEEAAKWNLVAARTGIVTTAAQSSQSLSVRPGPRMWPPADPASGQGLSQRPSFIPL